MKSQELRRAWIDFFAAKGHRLLPSASLVPPHLSTTLFTIAGMEQFVPVFLGEQPAPAPRAVTVQRCLRVAGAKSDIENVGRTGWHGTFLEMLGNFSFGDYYKAEAIAFAWEFCTQRLGLDPARIAVTVHVGDDEAERIWTRDVGLDPARVSRFDDDNFWTMGTSGPCGPCTELFYDLGERYATSPDDDGPNKGGRFVEFWNLVFQQYYRTADGRLEDLPRTAIDTGAGFERLLMICNGRGSMYETDVFADLVAAQPAAGGTLSPEERAVRRNVVADHARAATFLMNDGIYPSNTERGYVLRFLIRRAVRQGRLLAYPNGFFAALVPAVVASLEAGYPELRENEARIRAALETEEAAFERTLERGITMLDDAIGEAERGAGTIGGERAFVLHDTYGFPLELTREIAQESGVSVDTATFDALMAQQRQRARSDAAAKRSAVNLAELPAIKSQFTGYEGLEGGGTVAAILIGDRSSEALSEGEEGTLVLDASSFYAERGGQIGDRGTITGDAGTFEVTDTQYIGEAIAHRGVVREGRFSAGERVRTSVYDWWRREIRRHHTSAHLLQRALKEVLGDEVNQAGSWVGIDRMRFDFRWPGGGLSPEQKRSVTHRVNEMIRDDAHLETRVLSLEEAKKTGAIWMPGENYGERIRVVSAGPSVEFCGGTHSHSTGELGLFVIVSEASIGSGIRRIESCVSAAAEAYVDRQGDLVAALSATLSTAPEELADRVGRLQRDVKDLQSALGQLKARLAASDARVYVESAQRKGERTFVGAVVREAGAEALRHLQHAVRARLPSGVIALAGVDGDAVSLLVSVSDDLVAGGVHAGQLVKLAAGAIGGKGGGQAASAQGGGKNPAGADAAVEAMRAAVLA